MSTVVQYPIAIAIVVIALAVIATLPAKPAGRPLRDIIGRGLFCLVCGLIGMVTGILLEFPHIIASAVDSDVGGAVWTPLGFIFGTLIAVFLQVRAYLRSRNE